MSDLDARLARLRVFVAAVLPAHYQSIQADIAALLMEYDAQAARLNDAQSALRWAVTTLDGYRATEIANGLPYGTAHWMGGWADWLEQQARPAAGAAEER